ncbi:N-acetylglucosamine-6-phosphate deacetylase [Leptolyngbya sp. AN02str]|uniref:N-acetylglucosamine-6-phosphate deacetylase n=1 Tax=Leptolyngbya sp. AN02str TaxID=3423363 RepID=UPI003D31A7B9
MFALTNATVYTSQRVLQNHAVLMEGDRIVEVLPTANVPSTYPAVDVGGAHVAPGFVDLQLNGCGGVMFNDAIAPETLDIMHRTNLQSGTTSYLPTLITASDEEMLAAMDLVQQYRQQHPYQVLGLHLEGPYLNPIRKGIHNGDDVRPVDAAMLHKIAQYGRGTVKLVTMAAELAQPDDIQELIEAGIVISMGHSHATYEQAIAMFDAGVSMATHLFNAMTPWQGRSPGVVGAVFHHPKVTAGIIADGHHVHFASIALAKHILGDRLFFVTDATPPVGTNLDSFAIGGQQVFYRDGKCISADGTLGGSALTMIEAVANGVQQAGIPLDEALRMASTYPARAIAMEDELGAIAPGYVANLVVFSDAFQILGVCEAGTYRPAEALNLSSKG